MSAPVLESRGVVLLRGAREVLRGVDLRVGRGEFVALMGLSGGGKTTFLRAVAALEAFDAGDLTVDGVRLPAGGRPPAALLKQLRRKVGMVFQFHHLFEHMTALHNVWLAPVHVHAVAREDAERRARALLDQLGVGARAQALPRELSGGEAQRVAIARALANRPRIILADEPTAALDSQRAAVVMDLLRSVAVEQGAAVAVVTHDEKIFDRFDRLHHLRDGRLDAADGH
jgi:putative ABC transport system ATP-binding protein